MINVLYDRVLVSPLPIERSGLVVVGKFANYTSENLGRGRVVSLGPDTSGDLVVGDIVWIGKFMGKPVETEHGTMFMYQERHVLMVEEDEEDNE